MNKLFSIEDIEKMLENFLYSYPDDEVPITLAMQLAETMRENERLQEAINRAIAARGNIRDETVFIGSLPIIEALDHPHKHSGVSHNSTHQFTEFKDGGCGGISTNISTGRSKTPGVHPSKT